LQNFTLEALQCVFQRFTVLNANFGQRQPPVAGQHESFVLPVKNTASLSVLLKDKNRVQTESEVLENEFPGGRGSPKPG
jgi:hypothetical protein